MLTQRDLTPDGVIGYLVERGMITPNSREADVLREIADLPLPGPGTRVALSLALLRQALRKAGLPSARKWYRLERALRAHREILSGGTMHDAVVAGGYRDQVSMSKALLGATGYCPCALHAIAWPRLVDAWIERQSMRLRARFLPFRKQTRQRVRSVFRETAECGSNGRPIRTIR